VSAPALSPLCLILALLACLAGPKNSRAQVAPDHDANFKEISKIVGVEGQRTGDTYTLRIPRDDQIVFVDGNIVPVSAGLESVLHVYWCECGGYKSVGQFVLMEYEANDVIDALRKDYTGRGPTFAVGTVAPMFLNDRPRVVSLRFQGEGEPKDLAHALREALRWTGEQRGKPRADLKTP